MATITYTATNPATGRSWTRSSGTMAYTHATTAGTWHLTEAAARKGDGTVVPAVPTKINGKFTADDLARYAEIPGYSYAALVEVFKAKVQGAKPAKAAVEERVQGMYADLAAESKRRLAATKPRHQTAERPDLAAARAGVEQLDWAAAKVGEDGTYTAKSAFRTYRVRKAATVPGLWYAEQRGTGTWTAIGGACATQRQAEHLCQRYENGELRLSHKALRGVPFAELPALAS